MNPTQQQPRDIVKVIDAMLALIPADKKLFREDLKKVKYRSLYTAPEMVSADWRSAASTLGFHMSTTEEEWQKRVADIFEGREAISASEEAGQSDQDPSAPHDQPR